MESQVPKRGVVMRIKSPIMNVLKTQHLTKFQDFQYYFFILLENILSKNVIKIQIISLGLNVKYLLKDRQEITNPAVSSCSANL